IILLHFISPTSKAASLPPHSIESRIRPTPLVRRYRPAYLVSMKTRAQNMLVELLSLPTSPFNEQFVADYIRRWAAGRPGLELSHDEFGNLRLRLRRGGNAGRPLVFSAHMDHPGFEAQRMI